MVLSCTLAPPNSCLIALCALFSSSFSFLFDKEVSVTKGAISQKTVNTNWLFFKEIFHQLLKKYQNILPEKTAQELKRFSDIKLMDTTVIQVCKKLEKIFQGFKEGIPQIKIHTRFSLLGVK